MKLGWMAVAVALVPAAAAAQATGILPGQWEIAVTTESMVGEGLPPAAIAAMRGKVIRVRHCITPEEAARGPQDMLKADKSCAFRSYSAIGGRIHSEVSCKFGGGVMTSVSDGNFTPTGFTARGRTVMTGQMKMTTVATTVGKRIGACGK